MKHKYELTILMPCLNEHETICGCIDDALNFITDYGIDAEILVADSSSTDGSRELAYISGARVIGVKKSGYGCAIRAGIKAARGKYIIMGDSDGSYDFYDLAPYLERLREGWPLVMGNRFLEFDGSDAKFDWFTLRTDAPLGGIFPNAMPTIHKIGVPVLSAIGRFVYGTHVGDFHCGMRGFDTEESNNTALAAKTVIEVGDKSLGAIASVETAEIYGLKVLEANINKSGENTTRFAVLAKVPANSTSFSSSVLMFTVKHEAGSLAGAISIIGKYGFNMTALRSRPLKKHSWQYYFYVEIDGKADTENGVKMIAELSKVCDKLKVAGTFEPHTEI